MTHPTIDDFDVIGFDADDTLWQSEDGFRCNELRFVELVAPYAPDGVDVDGRAAPRPSARTSAPSATASSRSRIVDGRGGDHDHRRHGPDDGHRASWSRWPATSCEEPVQLLPHVPEVLAEVGADVPARADHQGRPRPPDPQGHDAAGSRTTSSTSRSCWRRTPRPTPGCCSGSASSPTGSAWSATPCAATSCR